MTKSITFPKPRSTARDKFVVGAPVKIGAYVPEHFIRNGELNRDDTYWIHEKYSGVVRGRKRALYIIRTADGRVVDNIEFYSYDLRHANG